MQSCQPAVTLIGDGKSFDLPIPRRAAGAYPSAHVIHTGFIMRAAVHVYERGKIFEKLGVRMG